MLIFLPLLQWIEPPRLAFAALFMSKYSAEERTEHYHGVDIAKLRGLDIINYYIAEVTTFMVLRPSHVQ